jgi:hypothetical protein
MKEIMDFLRRLFPNFFTSVLVLTYVISLVWWIFLDRSAEEVPLSNYLYTLLEGIIPIFGGLGGLLLAKKWGLFSSIIGRSLFFLSLGLVSWGIGTIIFVGYYNLLLGVEIPYPSLADVAYIVSWPLWGIGMIYLSRATGAKYALHNTSGKSVLIIIPLAIIALSYYLLVHVARGGVISASEGLAKVFFDLAYPIGDVVILTLVTLIYGLSFKYFGGKYKFAIYVLLLGFIVNYFADFSFSYQTTLETFVPGGLSDLLFTTAMFALSFGVNAIDSRILSSKEDVAV